ncbi:PRC-barrel domain containing protein [Kitasatospora sp. NA04385]|uniref:PRC-barrel domain-containing protein n=1 Tax=Kitasatospora sp. NA04385 TaxID=2742135 RepID=UPI001592727E|nr:PRC-barrel domain-containing protein [Kitasatospora sp. NA04385]QKW23921.1 PRC-barrel domain containing protein [Kitasatospora sp. NA04385]
MTSGLWGYQEAEGYAAGSDLTGYRVEATDGHIGKVDKHTEDVDAAYIVVDTGPWIFGREVLLPAGTITRVDHDEQTVFVDRSKDEVKNSPARDAGHHTDDPAYRDQLGGYYSGGTI